MNSPESLKESITIDNEMMVFKDKESFDFVTALWKRRMKSI